MTDPLERLYTVEISGPGGKRTVAKAGLPLVIAMVGKALADMILGDVTDISVKPIEENIKWENMNKP